jgi:hypothetical protein
MMIFNLFLVKGESPMDETLLRSTLVLRDIRIERGKSNQFYK